MLSIVGILNGITAIGVFLFGVLIGIFFIYKSKKTNVTLLTSSGLAIFFYGLMYTSPLIDFISIVSTNTNMNYALYGILAYFWGFPLMFSIIYTGAELIIPKNKKYVLIITLVLGVIYYLFIFLGTSISFNFTFPEVSGEDLLDVSFIFGSPAFLITALFLIYVFIQNGVGIMIKGLKSRTIIRKKFIMLSLGFGVFTISGALESLSKPGILLFVTRIFMVFSSWLWYNGLKEPSKAKKKKEIKLPSKKERELRSFLLGRSRTEGVSDKFVSFGKDLKKEILVFVSYATKDASLFKIKELAEKLTNYEEIDDVLYWQEDMKNNIITYMNDKVGKCDVMVMFCSKNALNSVPIKKEWTAADALGKPIIPVFFDQNHIPPLLSSRLGLEFDFYNMQKNVQELYHLILKKCSEQPSIPA